MDDNTYLYLIGGAIIALFIILLNNKRQKNTVTSYLKDAKDSRPVLLQLAIEKKLVMLKTTLYNTTSLYNSIGAPQPLNPVLEGRASGRTENKRQFIMKQLDKLEKSFASGNITLKAYDEELHQLVKKLRG